MAVEDIIETSDNESQLNSTTTKNENALKDLTIYILRQLHERFPEPVSIAELIKGCGIEKRTVYYATNVMMGLGFVKKAGVGKISWCSSNILNYLNEPNPLNTERIEILQRRKAQLIKEIEFEDELMQKMGSSDENIRQSYVTKKDLMNLKSVKGKVCFVIKTPENTFMDLSVDPPNYYLELTSNGGRVVAFFIENDKRKRL